MHHFTFNPSKNARDLILIVALTITFPIHSHATSSTPSLGSPAQALNLFMRSPLGAQRWNQLQKEPAIQRFLTDPFNSLRPKRRTISNRHGIESLFFQARHHGIEVVGAGTFQHLTAVGLSTTERLAQFDINPNPALGASEAEALARAHHPQSEILGRTRLRILPDDSQTSATLTYWVKLRETTGHHETFQVVINAHSGELIADISSHLTIAPIHVFEADASCQEVHPQTGAPISLDIANCFQSVTSGRVSPRADASSLRAERNTRKALQYYSTTFGRDGIDGLNSDVLSVVHVGERFANAFWDGENQMMGYGDGDGEETGDFTLAIDVAGHEMTHGVITSTADLLYFGESGALNEAYADFFGTMIENSGEWTMGTELFLNPGEKSAIRDLKNPGNLSASYRDESGKVVTKPYPRTAAEKFTTTDPCSSRKNDNCFVHINSTIPGHTGYRLVQVLGKERTEQLMYVTLTQYLTEKASFVQNKDATLQACQQLYSRAVCRDVARVFAEQGI
jgi:Zn-dependent metalloprotease